MSWNFLGDRSILCSNEATCGGLLDGVRMGADPQKDQALIRSLDLPVPPPVL